MTSCLPWVLFRSRKGSATHNDDTFRKPCSNSSVEEAQDRCPASRTGTVYRTRSRNHSIETARHGSPSDLIRASSSEREERLNSINHGNTKRLNVDTSTSTCTTPQSNHSDKDVSFSGEESTPISMNIHCTTPKISLDPSSMAISTIQVEQSTVNKTKDTQQRLPASRIVDQIMGQLSQTLLPTVHEPRTPTNHVLRCKRGDQGSLYLL